MAIVFEKTKVKGGFPIFWRGEFAVLPGDFKLKGTYPEGTKIPKGTPIKLDFDNMECSICKSARVLSGGTTTAPHVKKGSMLQVGDAVKVGESNSTVKSIDTKNASELPRSKPFQCGPQLRRFAGVCQRVRPGQIGRASCRERVSVQV